jgi:hypothetical protein
VREVCTCLVVFLDCWRFAAAGRLKQRLPWLAMLLLCCCLLPEGATPRTGDLAEQRNNTPNTLIGAEFDDKAKDSC